MTDQESFEAARARANRRDAVDWLSAHGYPTSAGNIAAAIAVHYQETIAEWINDPRVKAAFVLGYSVGTVRQAVIDAGGPTI